MLDGHEAEKVAQVGDLCMGLATLRGEKRMHL